MERVRDRQRQLGAPEAFEWVAELAPDLADVVAAVGLEVVLHPLMHLATEDFRPAAPPDGARVALVAADGDLAVAHGVAMVAFSSPGTGIGPTGHEALTGAAGSLAEMMLAFVRGRMERGLTVTSLALVDGRARAYARLGFRRIGTAGAAEPPGEPAAPS